MRSEDLLMLPEDSEWHSTCTGPPLDPPRVRVCWKGKFYFCLNMKVDPTCRPDTSRAPSRSWAWGMTLGPSTGCGDSRDLGLANRSAWRSGDTVSSPVVITFVQLDRQCYESPRKMWLLWQLQSENSDSNFGLIFWTQTLDSGIIHITTALLGAHTVW